LGPKLKKPPEFAEEAAFWAFASRASPLSSMLLLVVKVGVR
jgi:hypothetical protein